MSQFDLGIGNDVCFYLGWGTDDIWCLLPHLMPSDLRFVQQLEIFQVCLKDRHLFCVVLNWISMEKDGLGVGWICMLLLSLEL